MSPDYKLSRAVARKMNRHRARIHDPLWYKDAVIYEAHVKSFDDSNNDGIGDFNGLTQKLDCLQGLGVTCLWLLPFFSSPLKDDGYDVADYRNVHPSCGSLSAFTNSSGSIGSILVTGATSMAKRPSARSKVIDPAPPPVQPKPKRARAPAARSPEPSADDVRRRAYERYLERGGRHGQHFDDWLEAEKELRARFKTRSRRGEARFALGPTEVGPYDQPVLKRALRRKKT